MKDKINYTIAIKSDLELVLAVKEMRRLQNLLTKTNSYLLLPRLKAAQNEVDQFIDQAIIKEKIKEPSGLFEEGRCDFNDKSYQSAMKNFINA